MSRLLLFNNCLEQQILSTYRKYGELYIKIYMLRKQLNVSREVSIELRRIIVANNCRLAPDPEERFVQSLGLV